MRNLLERTGKSATDWAAIVEQDGPPSEKARREWLKSTHGFTTNYASWIAELSMGKGREHLDPTSYRNLRTVRRAMFAERAALMPLYDGLLWWGARLQERMPVRAIRSCRSIGGTSSPRSNRTHLVRSRICAGDRKATGRLVDTVVRRKPHHAPHSHYVARDIDAGVPRC